MIDVGIRIGNALGLPVLVYHGVREDDPYASHRLQRFILGASRDPRRRLHPPQGGWRRVAIPAEVPVDPYLASEATV